MKTKKELIFLYGIVLFHVFIMMGVSLFPKVMATYGDEVVYYDIAKSIIDGNGMKVHGAPFDFTNILYPLIIAPAFFVKDTIFRVYLISFINSLLVSLALIPTYYICRELKVNREHTWMVMAIVFCWPDMIVSATFMSEVLYFPLCVLTFYFCIKSFKDEKLRFSVLAGMMSYLSYFCKEVGLCIPVAFVAMEIVFGCEVLFERDKHNKILTFINRINWKMILSFCLTFVTCFLLVKYVFLRDVQNFYAKANSIDLSLLQDAYTRYYLLYVFIYYLMATVLAFFVFPVIIPIFKISYLNKTAKKTLVFGVLLLLGTILVITTTICIKEDIGREIPRVHLRYLFPLICLFLPIMFCEKNSELETDNNRRTMMIVIGAFLLITLIFKGVSIYASPTEISSLMIYVGARNLLPDLMGKDGSELIIYRSAKIVTILLFLGSAFGFLLFKRKGKKGIIRFCFASVIVLCLLNSFCEYIKIKRSYGLEKTMITDMDEINDYFLENNLSDSNTMYICDNPFDWDAKVFDLYFDASNNEYETTYQEIMEISGSDSRELSDLVIREAIWKNEYNMDSIDYIITETEFIEDYICGVELVDNIGGDSFFVYKNVNPKTLEKEVNKDSIEVRFTESLNNADMYVLKGISNCEGSYTWTEGDELVVHIDEVPFDRAKVIINVENTYDGQQDYLVLQDDEVIMDGSANGRDIIEFIAVPQNGVLEFTIKLLDAASPFENGESEDSRYLALALEKMVVNEYNEK